MNFLLSQHGKVVPTGPVTFERLNGAEKVEIILKNHGRVVEALDRLEQNHVHEPHGVHVRGFFVCRKPGRQDQYFHFFIVAGSLLFRS